MQTDLFVHCGQIFFLVCCTCMPENDFRLHLIRIFLDWIISLETKKDSEEKQCMYVN